MLTNWRLGENDRRRADRSPHLILGSAQSRILDSGLEMPVETGKRNWLASRFHGHGRREQFSGSTRNASPEGGIFLPPVSELVDSGEPQGGDVTVWGDGEDATDRGKHPGVCVYVDRAVSGDGDATAGPELR